MEPSPTELQAMNSIQAVLDWVPLRGAAAEAALAELGLEPEDPPRALAVLARGVIDKAIEDARIGETVKVPLNPAQAGKVLTLWETSRLRCGLSASQAELRRQTEEEKHASPWLRRQLLL